MLFFYFIITGKSPYPFGYGPWDSYVHDTAFFSFHHIFGNLQRDCEHGYRHQEHPDVLCRLHGNPLVIAEHNCSAVLDVRMHAKAPDAKGSKESEHCHSDAIDNPQKPFHPFLHTNPSFHEQSPFFKRNVGALRISVKRYFYYNIFYIPRQI